MAKYRLKAKDATRLSGLFFVIDGVLYPDMTDEEVKHNSHVNFFQSILKYEPKLREKYGKMSYLEFPRGMLIRDHDSGQIMISGPDMDDRQIKKVLRRFRYNTGAKYEFVYDEHYTLDYISRTIRNKLSKRYSADMVDLEVMEVEDHFANQMAQF